MRFCFCARKTFDSADVLAGKGFEQQFDHLQKKKTKKTFSGLTTLQSIKLIKLIQIGVHL